MGVAVLRVPPPGMHDMPMLARLPTAHTAPPVHAGGLLNEPRQGKAVGNVVMGGPDTYGLPPRKQPGAWRATGRRLPCCAVAGLGPILPMCRAVRLSAHAFATLPALHPAGSILRTQVAECCVAALVEPAAAGKVVEVIAQPEAQPRPYSELFASV